jgi:Cu(I)/Ag(I) efflux system membrane fusion protein
MKRLALGLLAALAAACSPAAEPTVVRSEGLEIRAAVDPETARVGENQLLIELRDEAGRPVENAALDVNVQMHPMGAMPAMGGAAHVAERGGGHYQAHFELAMGGTWQVELEARPPSGPVARAEGSLTVGAPGLRLQAVGTAPRATEHVHGGAAAPTGESAEFQIAPERLQSIGVRTARAARRTLTPSLRTTGRVTWDETALHDVSLKVRGWVGELHVDAVGDRVERGEVLFTLYSPELYAAQREYLLAREAQARARESGAPDRADYLVTAARNRLRLWDLAPADLERIAAAGAPMEFLPIRSPAGGYVMEKDVVAGSAVEPGQRLYRIAPLDPVWVEAEIYEQEIPLVTKGMRAAIEVPSLPGRRFEGTVAWVYPSVSESTRTARARIELANPDLALRPDMFATIHLDAAPQERLVVPLSAVLHAGERSFVFLDLGGGRLRPQPVEVGMRVGEEVEILAGVEEGQAVVASATFLVASESRLRAALDRW